MQEKLYVQGIMRAQRKSTIEHCRAWEHLSEGLGSELSVILLYSD